MNDLGKRTVGSIVAENIAYAQIFRKHGIDFCCGGEILLQDATKKKNVSLEMLIEELEQINSYSSQDSKSLNFNAWPTDLLIDYVTKYHHRYIRNVGKDTLALVVKVEKAHSNTDPQLIQVRALFEEGLEDLESHLMKEEEILFPFAHQILDAKTNNTPLQEFHCGSIQNPIRVMLMEHDNEGERFRKIAELTNNYTPPAHACNSYRLMLNQLREFEEHLHIHIHVENNILFPRIIQMENSLS